MYPVDLNQLSHRALWLAANEPGEHGRLRLARIISNRPVTQYDLPPGLPPLTPTVELTLRDVVALVDALIDGQLLTQTHGARPTIVVTRAGHRSLDALEKVQVAG